MPNFQKKIKQILNISTTIKENEYLTKENRELKHTLRQPANKHLKLYRHYKQEVAKAEDEIKWLKRQNYLVQRDNKELIHKVATAKEANDELKQRAEAHKNSIEHLLVLLDEKDEKIEHKDAFIQKLMVETIIQPNTDKYFDFL